MKIFFDTNVLVSALATRGLCADLLRATIAAHVVITGEVNIAELKRVLRDKLKVPAANVQFAEEMLRQHTVVPKPRAPSVIPVRDPDDRWVLESAVQAQADVLVTGDGDLLAVAAISPVKIVEPRGLWNLIRSPR